MGSSIPKTTYIACWAFNVTIRIIIYGAAVALGTLAKLRVIKKLSSEGVWLPILEDFYLI